MTLAPRLLRPQGDAEFLTEAAYSVLIQHVNLLPVLGIVRARDAQCSGRLGAMRAGSPGRRVAPALSRARRRWTTMSAAWSTRT